MARRVGTSAAAGTAAQQVYITIEDANRSLSGFLVSSFRVGKEHRRSQIDVQTLLNERNYRPVAVSVGLVGSLIVKSWVSGFFYTERSSGR